MSTISPTQSWIYNFVQLLAKRQIELEEMRQNLNTEIIFNLHDLYLGIAGSEPFITLKKIVQFIKPKEKNDSIGYYEKFIKWNNRNSSYNLTFPQFSGIFLSKQNKLLAKMVLQRESIGVLPNYILELAKQIIIKQLSIHKYILNSNFICSEELQVWVDSITGSDGIVDQKQFIESLSFHELDDQSSIFERNQESFALRFLSHQSKLKGADLKNFFSLNQNKNTFIFMKSNILSTNISSPKSKIINETQYIRSQFFDCINRPKIVQNNQFRTVKSIQRHINRVNSKKDLKIIRKSKKSDLLLEHNSLRLFQKLKQMVILERQVESFKKQMCLCTDFYPVLFYENIYKDKKSRVLPSFFLQYLKYFGITLDIDKIYVFFKKICKEKNNLCFNSFCRIFDVCDSEYLMLEKNRFIQKLEDVSVETKKLFLSLIQKSIENTWKTQKIKYQIINQKLQLSKIFSSFLTCSKNQVCKIQFRYQWKKNLQQNIEQSDLTLLWKKIFELNPEQKLQKNLFENCFNSKINLIKSKSLM